MIQLLVEEGITHSNLQQIISIKKSKETGVQWSLIATTSRHYLDYEVI